MLFSCEGNLITGSIPTEYANWTLMSHFSMEDNLLTGSLPPSLGLWGARLDYFNVGGNQLSGTLPPEYAPNWTMIGIFYAPNWNSSWERVTSIDVDDNLLTGPLPNSYALWNATITSISAANNKLIGAIPSTWASSMTSLSGLVLRNNSLVGTKLKLTILSLSFNDLSGSLPPPSAYPFLWILDVQNNSRLTGSFTLPIMTAVASVCGTLYVNRMGLEGLRVDIGVHKLAPLTHMA
ncbi:GP46-like surface antigen, putative [Bodo saltans]|uniref:GP46-like surface antigen, putative n=1 Tax=Bodo saltans TaxID=75058 RepID=A0A0S4IP14_BODSA|nr:GP46-like surface antigen, putative [Bodo saltans]|eukprot:CUE69230.1 GP46-like surface antigen, putative [Bodo saltans]